MIYDPIPNFHDPKPDEIRVSRLTGSRKILGRGGDNVLPLKSSHCITVQEKRAAHWLGIWERFWSGEK